MLRLVTIAIVLRLVFCAVGQNVEETGDLSDDNFRGTEDRLVFPANGLRSFYEERPLARQRRFLQTAAIFAVRQMSFEIASPLRASSLMLFGHRAVPHFVEEVGTPHKRKSAYMRFGKRSDPDVDGSIFLAPVATVSGTVPAMDKRKSAYMRFGKRHGLFGIGKLSDASIAATLNRNMARMR